MPTVHSKRSLSLLATLLVALMASAAAAQANVAETIIQRCAHNQSLSGFSESAYNEALKQLSATTEEYSPCSSEIEKAQLAAAASGGRGGGGGTAGQNAARPVAVTPTPSEQRALTHAASASGAEPVELGGRVIRPGVVHVDIGSAFSSLPTPLLATLAFVLACVLLIMGVALRRRVRAGRAAG